MTHFPQQALDELGLPFKVKKGIIGHVKLTIPSYNPYALRTKALDLTLEDIVVLAEKATQTPEEQERRAKAALTTQLKSAALSRVRLMGDELAPTASGDASAEGEADAGLVAAIIENICVHVHNVHLRFEDTTSHTGHPFAVGVTFSSFVTRNASGVKTQGSGAAQPVTVRTAQLSNLAIYWDAMAGDATSAATSTAVSMVRAAPLHTPGFVEFMRKGIATPSNTPQHQYLLQPTSPAATLVRAPVGTRGVPRLLMQLQLQGVRFALDRRQFVAASFLQLWLELHQFRPQFRLAFEGGRRVAGPHALAPGSPARRAVRRQWWFYFGQCMMSFVRAEAAAAADAQSAVGEASPSAAELPAPKRRLALAAAGSGVVQIHKNTVKAGSNRFRNYIDAYKPVVIQERAALREGKSVLEAFEEAGEGIPKGVKGGSIEAMEALFSTKQILFLRWMAEQEVKEQERKAAVTVAADKAKRGGGLFGWLGGGSGGPSLTEATSTSVLTAAELQGVWALVDTESDSARSAAGSGAGNEGIESEGLRLQLQLASTEFHVLDASGQAVLVAQLAGAAAVTHSARRTAFALQLEHLSVHDAVVADTAFPTLVGLGESTGSQPTEGEVAIAENLLRLVRPPPAIAHAVAGGGSNSAREALSSSVALVTGELRSKPKPTSADHAGPPPMQLDSVHLSARSQPLTIVMAAPAASATAAVFASPASAALRERLVSRLSKLAAASSGADSFAMLQDRARLQVDLKLHAPVVVIPSDIKRADCSAVRLHVGTLTARSVEPGPEVLSLLPAGALGRGPATVAATQKAYNTISIALQDVRAQVGQPGAEADVLRKVSFGAHIAVRAVSAAAAPAAPQIMLASDLPAVSLQLSLPLLVQMQSLGEQAARLGGELARADAAAQAEATRLALKRGLPTSSVSPDDASVSSGADSKRLAQLDAVLRAEDKRDSNVAVVKARLGHVQVTFQGVSGILAAGKQDAAAAVLPTPAFLLGGGLPENDSLSLHIGRLSVHLGATGSKVTVQTGLQSLHLVDTVQQHSLDTAVMMTSTPQWEPQQTLKWLHSASSGDTGSPGVETPDDLISVQLTAPLTAPESLDGSKQPVQVQVSARQLSFMYNPATIVSLAGLADAFMLHATAAGTGAPGDVGAEATASTSTQGAISALLSTPSYDWQPIAGDGSSLLEAPATAPTLPAAALPDIDMHISLASLEVRLWRSVAKYTVAAIQATDFAMHVETFPDSPDTMAWDGAGAVSARVKGSLGDLRITEHAPVASHFRQILGKSGHATASDRALVEFGVSNVQLLPDSDAGSSGAKYGLAVRADVAPVQVVILNEALMDLVDYLLEKLQPSLNALLDATSSDPATSGQQSVANFMQGSREEDGQNVHVITVTPQSRMNLEVHLDSPSIALPKHRLSGECVVLLAGGVGVTTQHFEQLMVHHGSTGTTAQLPREGRSVTVNRVGLLAVQLDLADAAVESSSAHSVWTALSDATQGATAHSLLTRTVESISVQLTTPMVAELYLLLPAMDIGVEVGSIHLQLTKQHLDLLQGLADGNLGDKARSSTALLLQRDSTAGAALHQTQVEQASQGWGSNRIQVRLSQGVQLDMLHNDAKILAHAELSHLCLGMLGVPAHFMHNGELHSNPAAEMDNPVNTIVLGMGNIFIDTQADPGPDSDLQRMAALQTHSGAASSVLFDPSVEQTSALAGAGLLNADDPLQLRLRMSDVCMQVTVNVQQAVVLAAPVFWQQLLDFVVPGPVDLPDGFIKEIAAADDQGTTQATPTARRLMTNVAFGSVSAVLPAWLACGSDLSPDAAALLQAHTKDITLALNGSFELDSANMDNVMGDASMDVTLAGLTARHVSRVATRSLLRLGDAEAASVPADAGTDVLLPLDVHVNMRTKVLPMAVMDIRVAVGDTQVLFSPAVAHTLKQWLAHVADADASTSSADTTVAELPDKADDPPAQQINAELVWPGLCVTLNGSSHTQATQPGRESLASGSLVLGSVADGAIVPGVCAVGGANFSGSRITILPETSGREDCIKLAYNTGTSAAAISSTLLFRFEAGVDSGFSRVVRDDWGLHLALNTTAGTASTGAHTEATVSATNSLNVNINSQHAKSLGMLVDQWSLYGQHWADHIRPASLVLSAAASAEAASVAGEAGTGDPLPTFKASVDIPCATATLHSIYKVTADSVSILPAPRPIVQVLLPAVSGVYTMLGSKATLDATASGFEVVSCSSDTVPLHEDGFARDVQANRALLTTSHRAVQHWSTAWLSGVDNTAAVQNSGASTGFVVEMRPGENGSSRLHLVVPPVAVNWLPEVVDSLQYFAKAHKLHADSNSSQGVAGGAAAVPSTPLAAEGDIAVRSVVQPALGSASVTSPVFKLRDLPSGVADSCAQSSSEAPYCPAALAQATEDGWCARFTDSLTAKVASVCGSISSAAMQVSVSADFALMGLLPETHAGDADDESHSSTRHPIGVVVVSGVAVQQATTAEGVSLLHASLQDLQVIDTSRDVHTSDTYLLRGLCVASTSDEEVPVLRLSMAAYEPHHPQYTAASSEVAVSMGSMQLLHAHTATMRLLDYFLEGVLPSLALDPALELAAADAHAGMDSALGSRMSLAVALKPLHVTVPVDPGAYCRSNGTSAALKVTTSAVTVSNALEATAVDDSSLVIDTIQVGIFDMQATLLGSTLAAVPQFSLQASRVTGALSNSDRFGDQIVDPPVFDAIQQAMSKRSGQWAARFDAQLSMLLPAVSIYAKPLHVRALVNTLERNISPKDAQLSSAKARSVRVRTNDMNGALLVAHPSAGAAAGALHLQAHFGTLELQLQTDGPEARQIAKVDVQNLTAKLHALDTVWTSPGGRPSQGSLQSVALDIASLYVAAASSPGGVLHPLLRRRAASAGSVPTPMLAVVSNTLTLNSAAEEVFQSTSAVLADCTVIAAGSPMAQLIQFAALSGQTAGRTGEASTHAAQFQYVASRVLQPARAVVHGTLDIEVLLPTHTVEGCTAAWDPGSNGHLQAKLGGRATVTTDVRHATVGLSSFPALQQLRAAVNGSSAESSLAARCRLPLPDSAFMLQNTLIQLQNTHVEAPLLRLDANLHRQGQYAVQLMLPSRFSADVTSTQQQFVPVQVAVKAQKVFAAPPSTMLRKQRADAAHVIAVQQHDFVWAAQQRKARAEANGNEAAVQAALALNTWLSCTRLPAARTSISITSTSGEPVVLHLGFRDLLLLSAAGAVLSSALSKVDEASDLSPVALPDSPVEDSPFAGDTPTPVQPPPVPSSPERVRLAREAETAAAIALDSAFAPPGMHIDDFVVSVPAELLAEVQLVQRDTADMALRQRSSSATALGLLSLHGLVSDADTVVSINGSVPSTAGDITVAAGSSAVELRLRSMPLHSSVYLEGGVRVILVNDAAGRDGALLALTLPSVMADVRGNPSTLPATAAASSWDLRSGGRALRPVPALGSSASGTLGWYVPPGSAVPSRSARPALLSAAAQFRATAELEVMNSSAGVWEPLVERFMLRSIAVAMDMGGVGSTVSTAPVRQVFLETIPTQHVALPVGSSKCCGGDKGESVVGYGPHSGRLEVNVSFATFSGLLAALHAWEAVSSEQTQPSDGATLSGPGSGQGAVVHVGARFIVRNDVGTPLKFVPEHLVEAMASSSGASAKLWPTTRLSDPSATFATVGGVILKPEEEAPLAFQSDDSLSDISRSLSSAQSPHAARTVHIWIQGAKTPLQAVSLRPGIRRNTVTLQGQGGRTQQVVVSTQVKIIEGCCVLSVRSSACIHNHTHFDCVAMVHDPVSKSLIPAGIAPAHGALALPPKFAHASAVSLQPVAYRDDFDSKRSVAVGLSDAISLRTYQQQEVMAQGSADSSSHAADFHDVVLWTRVYRRLDGAYTVLSLRPSVMFQNTLLRNVEVRVGSPSSGAALHVPPGASVPVYGASALNDTPLFAKVDGHGFTRLPSTRVYVEQSKKVAAGSKNTSCVPLLFPREYADGSISTKKSESLHTQAEMSAAIAIGATQLDGSPQRDLPRVSITLLASHWVRDATGFGLDFCLGRGTKRTAAASSQSTGETAEATEELWQNQRSVFGSWTTAAERSEWTNTNFKSATQAQRNAALPAGWEWTGPWHVSNPSPLREDGWDYAFNWPNFDSGKHTARGRAGVTDWVRRRKWLRTRRRVAVRERATTDMSSTTPIAGDDNLLVSAEVQDDTLSLQGVSMLHGDQQHKLMLRCGHGVWKSSVRLGDTISAANVILPMSSAGGGGGGGTPAALNTVVWSAPAPAPFQRTKVLTVSPSLWLVNATPSALDWVYVPQARRPQAEQVSSVQPGRAVPLHMDISDALAKEKLPHIAIAPDLCMGAWSRPFSVGDLQDTSISIPVAEAGVTPTALGSMDAGHAVYGIAAKAHDTIPNAFVVTITQQNTFLQSAAPAGVDAPRPPAFPAPVQLTAEGTAARQELAADPEVTPPSIIIRNNSSAVISYVQRNATYVDKQNTRQPVVPYAALPGEAMAFGWFNADGMEKQRVTLRGILVSAWNAAHPSSGTPSSIPSAQSSESQAVCAIHVGEAKQLHMPGDTARPNGWVVNARVRATACSVEIHITDEAGSAVRRVQRFESSRDTTTTTSVESDSAVDALMDAYEADDSESTADAGGDLDEALDAAAAVGGAWGLLSAQQHWDDLVRVTVAGVGVSLIDYRPAETLYVSLDRMHLLGSRTVELYTASLTVRHMQVDDMSHEATFITVFSSMTAHSALVRALSDTAGDGAAVAPTALSGAGSNMFDASGLLQKGLAAGLSTDALLFSVVRVRHPKRLLLKEVTVRLSPVRVCASYSLILSSLLQGMIVQHTVSNAQAAASVLSRQRHANTRLVVESVARGPLDIEACLTQLQLTGEEVDPSTMGLAVGDALPQLLDSNALSGHLAGTSASAGQRTAPQVWCFGADPDMVQDGFNEPPPGLRRSQQLSDLEIAEALSTAQVLGAVATTAAYSDALAVAAAHNALQRLSVGDRATCREVGMSDLGIDMAALQGDSGTGSVLSRALARHAPVYIARLDVGRIQAYLSYTYAGQGESGSLHSALMQQATYALTDVRMVDLILRSAISLSDAELMFPDFGRRHLSMSLPVLMGQYSGFLQATATGPEAITSLVLSSNVFWQTGDFKRRITSRVGFTGGLQGVADVASFMTDAVGNVVDVVGRGATAAAGDSEALARVARSRQAAAGENVALGAAKDIVMKGVLGGVMGVFTKPVQGAKSGGIAGFAKGVGQGLVGAVAGPLIGIGSAAQRISTGISTAAATDLEKLTIQAPLVRRRLRRAIVGTSRCVSPYCLQEAFLARQCRVLHAKHRSGDLMVAHLPLGTDGTGQPCVVLASSTSVLVHRLPARKSALERAWKDLTDIDDSAAMMLQQVLWSGEAQQLHITRERPDCVAFITHGSHAEFINFGSHAAAQHALLRLQSAQAETMHFRLSTNVLLDD